MQSALDKERAFEEFVLERDILYFRIGDHGLVSFHGRNFNWRKRYSSDELQRMLSNQTFFQVNTDCYVNTGKISAVKEGSVLFDTGDSEGKSVMITKLRQGRLKDILTRRLAKEA
jgi:hypothetical protein